MADLDYRIILGSQPLASPAEMQDQRANREIQQQEVELRRQEILARRDALRQRNMPPPVDESKEFQTRLSKAKTLAQLLDGADEHTYPVVRDIARHLVGDDAISELPEQWDEPTVRAIARLGKEQTAKAVEQFTLSPGAKRFDATGKVIAEVPAAERAAGEQGFTLAPGARRYGPDGKLIATAPERPQAAGGGAKPGRPVTSGDANRIAELNNSLKDLDTLGATLQGVKGATGAAAQAGAALPNFVTEMTGWGTTAKEKQAVIDRVKQVIGKALEGGVLRKEDEYKYSKILPTIGDLPDVVTSKLNGLKQAIEQKREESLSALEDAGYDASRFRARVESSGGGKSGGKKIGRFTVETE